MQARKQQQQQHGWWLVSHVPVHLRPPWPVVLLVDMLVHCGGFCAAVRRRLVWVGLVSVPHSRAVVCARVLRALCAGRVWSPERAQSSQRTRGVGCCSTGDMAGTCVGLFGSVGLFRELSAVRQQGTAAAKKAGPSVVAVCVEDRAWSLVIAWCLCLLSLSGVSLPCGLCAWSEAWCCCNRPTDRVTRCAADQWLCFSVC